MFADEPKSEANTQVRIGLALTVLRHVYAQPLPTEAALTTLADATETQAAELAVPFPATCGHLTMAHPGWATSSG
ncbi:hypothetical protein [Dactylosporangium darangshiense]|uniref:Uncharacterized protein n=1 Tax=Dactylosporangium darangshiense TaxID=579108 RepID=A0ABP8CTP8_9ACTN